MSSSLLAQPVHSTRGGGARFRMLTKKVMAPIPKRQSSSSTLDKWALIINGGVARRQSNEIISKEIIESDTALYQRFKKFTPAILRRQLSQRFSQKLQLDPNWIPQIEAYSETVYATVLLADISGFTRLSSRLSVEELKLHINAYFTELLDITRDHGGDAIKFLGDAVLIIFPIADNVGKDEYKAATTLMASLCALELISKCGAYNKGDGQNEVSLRLHCGIGAGLVHCMCMGDLDRWEFLVSGEPLEQVSEAMSCAGAGEVCISNTALAFVEDAFESKKATNNYSTLTGKRANYNYATSLEKTTPIRKERSFMSPRKKRLSQLAKQDSTDVCSDSELLSSSHHLSSSLLRQRSMKQNISSRLIRKQSSMEQTPSHRGSVVSVDSEESILSITGANALRVFNANPTTATTTTTSNLLSDTSNHQRIQQPPPYTPDSSPNDPRDCGESLKKQDLVEILPETEEDEIIEVKSNNNIFSLLCCYQNNSAITPTNVKIMKTASKFSESSLKNRSIPGRLGTTGRSKSIRMTDVRALEQIKTIPVIKKTRQYLRGFLENKDETNDTFINCDTGGDIVPLEPKIGPLLKYFAHVAATNALNSGNDSYLYEIRNVTTIFVLLYGFESDLSLGLLKRPQKAISVCLGCLKTFGGSLRQYTVDDKGCVLIGAFGLPGSSHEDNSRRAIEAALSMTQDLSSEGLWSRIGISEGRVYCGLVGSTDRCEYAMMGASVNLAARLMGSCLPGQVLVSESVYLAAQAAFIFTSTSRVVAKGYSAPVAVYRPTERAYGNMLLSIDLPGDVGFVGRVEEKHILVNAILDSRKTNKKKVYSIRGPPRIGKTRLIVEALKEVTTELSATSPTPTPDSENKLNVLVGTASSAFLHLHYYVVRQLLEQIIGLRTDNSSSSNARSNKGRKMYALLGLPGTTSDNNHTQEKPDAVETVIRKWMHDHMTDTTLDFSNYSNLPRGFSVTKHFVDRSVISVDNTMGNNGVPGTTMTLNEEYSMEELLPLFASVFGVPIADNAFTSELNSSVENARMKRDIIDAMIQKILLAGMKVNKVDVIIIDNVQWVDNLSLGILINFVRKFPKGVFISTGRVVTEEVIHDEDATEMSKKKNRIHRLLALENLGVYVDLKPLDTAEIKVIIERSIGSRLCQTHPSMISSVNIESIMERTGGSPYQAGVLATSLKNAFFKGNFTGIEDLPAGDDKVIIAQFDTHSKVEQAALKTASVIGVNFTEVEVSYLLGKQDMSLDEKTKDRLKSSLLLTYDGDGDYRFNDKFIQESIYNLMLVSQRERIHNFFGDYLVSLKSDRIDDIIYHYSHGDHLSQKVFYLKQAIENAKRDQTYHKAYKYLGTLIKIATNNDVECLLQNCLTVANKNTETNSFVNICKCLSVLFGSNPNKNYIDRDTETEIQTFTSHCRRWLTTSDFARAITLPTSLEMTVTTGTGVGSDLVEVIRWLAEGGISQFMLGNLTEASNLFSFSMRNLELPTQNSSRNLFSRIAKVSDLPSSNIPNLSWNDFDTFLDAFECLIFISLLRGMSHEARRISSFLHQVLTLLDGNENSELLPKERIIQRARVFAIHSVVLTSASKNEIDRDKALSVFKEAQQQMKLIPKSSPHITHFFCMAIHSMSMSHWQLAADNFHFAAELAVSDRNRVKQNYALLGKAWCSFLCGRVAIANNALENVVNFAASESYIPLHVWALELEILMKTFTKDFEGAEEAQRLIRTLQRRGGTTSDAVFRKEHFSASTSAILAFSMSSNQQYEKASSLAVYSCTHLSSPNRLQGFALGGLYLFCSIYALIECALFKSKPHNTSTAYLRSESRDISNYNCKQLLDLSTSSINGLFKLAERFPCLLPLYWSVAIKSRIIDNTDFSSLSEFLNELDRFVIENKGLFKTFLFAEAFVHLQRANLCSTLKLSSSLFGARNSSYTCNVCMSILAGAYDLELRDTTPSDGGDCEEAFGGYSSTGGKRLTAYFDTDMSEENIEELSFFSKGIAIRNSIDESLGNMQVKNSSRKSSIIDNALIIDGHSRRPSLLNTLTDQQRNTYSYGFDNQQDLLYGSGVIRSDISGSEKRLSFPPVEGRRMSFLGGFNRVLLDARQGVLAEGDEKKSVVSSVAASRRQSRDIHIQSTNQNGMQSDSDKNNDYVRPMSEESRNDIKSILMDKRFDADREPITFLSPQITKQTSSKSPYTPMDGGELSRFFQTPPPRPADDFFVDNNSLSRKSMYLKRDSESISDSEADRRPSSRRESGGGGGANRREWGGGASRRSTVTKNGQSAPPRSFSTTTIYAIEGHGGGDISPPIDKKMKFPHLPSPEKHIINAMETERPRPLQNDNDNYYPLRSSRKNSRHSSEKITQHELKDFPSMRVTPPVIPEKYEMMQLRSFDDNDDKQ